MLTIQSTINIAGQTVPQIIPVVQGDTGRSILFTLADFTIPQGSTATYYVQKPSGEAVYNAATIDGNTVLVELTAQSIIEHGDNYGQVRIENDGEVVTSFDFILLVKPFRGIDATQSTTEMNIFDKAVEQAEEAIDDAKDAALDEINQTTGNFAEAFSASVAYSAGEYVMQSGHLYRFTSNHAAGAWTGSDAEAVTVGEELTDVKDGLNSVGDIIKVNQTDAIPFEIAVTGKTVIYSTGELDTLSTRCVTNFVNIKGYKTLLYKRIRYTAGSTAGMAFYDENQAYISGERCVINAAENAYILKNITVPANAVYARFTTFKDTETYGNFELYGQSYIFDAIKTVEDEVVAVQDRTEALEEKLTITDNYADISSLSYEQGGMYTNGTKYNTLANTVRNTVSEEQPAVYGMVGSMLSCTANHTMRLCVYSVPTGVAAINFKKYYDGDASNPIVMDVDGYCRFSITDTSGTTLDLSDPTVVAELVSNLNAKIISSITKGEYVQVKEDVEELKHNENNYTDLVSAQNYISQDWHFPFINVWQNMGLGSAHIIPGTATIWNPSGTVDLNQKGVWMSDGVHPFKGDGVTDMYAKTISGQLAMIPPSYKDGVGETSPTVWVGRKLLWMGTSIPAGSDPDAGSGTGSTYPALVAQQLGATVTNIAKGSSCVRINASTGEYTGMMYSHFLRSLSRTVAECDAIASDWANIYPKINNAPSTLSAEALQTMKNYSFENLLVPYLDGTNTMPDLFVIDHGHNDVRPKGIDGKNDLWINPSESLITDGTLADDAYMSANNYANLKTALGNDLTGISDIETFAATLNRNCFKGAVNFIITVILAHNPYARIVIVSDYN